MTPVDSACSKSWVLYMTITYWKYKLGIKQNENDGTDCQEQQLLRKNKSLSPPSTCHEWHRHKCKVQIAGRGTEGRKYRRHGYNDAQCSQSADMGQDRVPGFSVSHLSLIITTTTRLGQKKSRQNRTTVVYLYDGKSKYIHIQKTKLVYQNNI